MSLSRKIGRQLPMLLLFNIILKAIWNKQCYYYTLENNCTNSQIFISLRVNLFGFDCIWFYYHYCWVKEILKKMNKHLFNLLIMNSNLLYNYYKYIIVLSLLTISSMCSKSNFWKLFVVFFVWHENQFPDYHWQDLLPCCQTMSLLLLEREKKVSFFRSTV